MKNGLVILVSAMVLFSSCGTYTGQGAATGGWFGSMIGSAIGGISGGHRGSDIGSLVGMAGGAIVGAAIGQAADNAEQQKYEDYKAARQRTNPNRRNVSARQSDDYAYSEDSGFDANNGGDDRLFGFGEDLGGPSSYSDITAPSALEIRNARLLDASHDGVLMRGEEARVVFEIYNNSSKPVFGVQPSVSEITDNKHIHISENILIESIAPGKGVRYTASIKADSGLKNGEAIIRIGVLQANKEVTSQAKQFTIQTKKK